MKGNNSYSLCLLVLVFCAKLTRSRMGKAVNQVTLHYQISKEDTFHMSPIAHCYCGNKKLV